MSEAEDLLDSIRARGNQASVVTYNTIIEAVRKAGDFEEVDRYHQQMIEDGIRADSYTYNQLILSRKAIGDWNGAVSLFHEMLDESIEPNPWVCSAIWHVCQGYKYETKNALEEIENRCLENGYDFRAIRLQDMSHKPKKNRHRRYA